MFVLAQFLFRVVPCLFSYRFYGLVAFPARFLLPFPKRYPWNSLFLLSVFCPVLVFLFGLYPAPKRTDGRTQRKFDVAFTFLSSRQL